MASAELPAGNPSVPVGGCGIVDATARIAPSVLSAELPAGDPCVPVGGGGMNTTAHQDAATASAKLPASDPSVPVSGKGLDATTTPPPTQRLRRRNSLSDTADFLKTVNRCINEAKLQPARPTKMSVPSAAPSRPDYVEGSPATEKKRHLLAKRLQTLAPAYS